MYYILHSTAHFINEDKTINQFNSISQKDKFFYLCHELSQIVPQSERYDITKLRFKGDKSDFNAALNWYAKQIEELNADTENVEYKEKLATITVLLIDDISIDKKEALDLIAAKVSSTPIVADSIKWILKPYNPYYWPQGERPPVGIFTPRIRTPRDNNRNDRGRGKKNDRNDRSDRPKGPRKNERFDSSNLNKKALKSADIAMSKLKRDKKLNEIELDPMNSFYRRVQHKHIVDNGFDTYSVGDGADRKVVIKRK